MQDMQEQARLVSEAARSLVAVAPEGWSKLGYTAIMLRGQQEERVWVDLPEGRKSIWANDDTMGYMYELRSLMYEPGEGTFYTANIVITAADGSVQTHFEYDEEPDWDMAPGQYLVDLEAFPRDEEHRPEWLRSLVQQQASSAEAAAPGGQVDPELEAIGQEMFSRMPGGPAPISSSTLPDGLGIVMARQSRGGGKLFIAPDRSVMFSPSAESVEQGLERFRAGERWRPADQ